MAINKLKQRILEIAKKRGLSHVGSALSAVDILDTIYPKGEVVVSSGHAGLAYYVVREKYDGVDAEEQFEEFGVHAQMYGSLGHGFPIAIGKALANRKKHIYCLTSDGEWMEGSMWESLRLADKLKLNNLHVYVNANGYGGMGPINSDDLEDAIYAFPFPNIEVIYTDMKPLKKRLEAHYEKVV